MQEDLAAMKKTKESEIAELRSKKERLVHNFNLLHEATKEEIALIDQQIAKAAEGLYHLESMRTGRGGAAPKPAPASPAQEAARTAAASPASPARAASATRIETLEREGKERHVWEDGRHKVFDSDGRLLLDEEEARAREISFFPHLILPDLVEVHIAELGLQPPKPAMRRPALRTISLQLKCRRPLSLCVGS